MDDRPTVTVAVGDRAIADLTALASYVDARSAAFCTSSAWLGAAARHLPATPVVITVRADGAPVALATLGVTDRRGARRITLLGGDQNDYGRFFYDDEHAARLLADAIVAWIAEQRRWTVTFGQLSADDRVAGLLVGRLAGAVLEPGPPMPQIVGLDGDFRISKNRRNKYSQATNRVEADGRTWERIVVDTPVALDRWLPVVIDLRRRRDHASARRSHLDDPALRAFYEAVVSDRIARAAAELHLFVVDGVVAGYSLVMLDGSTHRLYDGRVAEEWPYYRGGMVCGVTAVMRAIEAEGVTTFDWLRGRNDTKFGNDETTRLELRAASHGWIAALDDWEGSARQRIKATLPAAAVRRLVTR